MGRVTPGVVVHPREQQDEGVQGYPSSKTHLLLPWDAFRDDVSSGVAAAHSCGFSVPVCRNQWVAHETGIWGLSFAPAAPPLHHPVPCSTLRHFTANPHGPSRVSMRGFLLGRAPAGHNLTHVCSPSYVSGQPKAPNYRHKRLHRENTTVCRAWEFSASYHIAASVGKRPIYLNKGNNNLREG